MGRFAPIWNSFNAGELSPLIDGRTDQDKYFAGCKRLVNMIPTVQGPAQRRGGTRYLGSTKGDARTWFTTFEFSQAQSYVLALTDLAMRFWVNRGQLLSGGTPYEIATPWSAANLITDEGTFALRSVQSADVMWICQSDGAVAPQKLSRLGATNWTLAQTPFVNGPFEDIDPDSTVNVTSSGVNGVVTLTASAPIFTADDIGTSFYMEQEASGVPAWQVQTAAPALSVRKYAGNYYQSVQTYGTGKTGANPPVHTQGIVIDGPAGLAATSPDGDGIGWEYRHSGYGWIQITSIGGGGTTATGNVVLNNGRLQLPQGVTLGTRRWAKSAFSPLRGWPSDVTFFRGRLCYARGRELFLSVVGDYDDFSRKDGPDVTKETAIVLKLASDRLDLIRWIAPSAALLVGTARNEIAVREQTDTQVFAADNATSVPQTEYGSRLLEPLRVGNAVLFVQRAGRKLRELVFDYTSDRYKADDLTVLSEHIVDAGVADMDFQQEPDNIVWCALNDGTVAALTYNRERGVIAWVPHVIGGPGAFVETVAVIAAPDGRRDDVWFVVRRTINGNTVRYVEYLEDNRLVETDTADGLYGDAGITYDGAPTKTVSGLGHLEGATVQILADGSAHAEETVSGGQITLNRFASKVQIGFDNPAQVQTMRADGGVQDGTAQTRAKSIGEVWLRLHNTIGGLVGPAFDRLDPIPGLRPSGTIGTRPPLFSGDKRIEFPADAGTDGYICVESSPMLPLTLVAITARMEVND